MKVEQLIAHRGFCHRYPENTLLAFRKAIEAGALALEADLQLSYDGVPFLFHDRELQRLTGEPGHLEQKTAAEIAQLSAYAPERFGDQFLGEPIPRLESLLALLAESPGVTLYLEIKRVSLASFAPEQLLDRIWPLIWPLRQRIVLISFSLPVLAVARSWGYPRIAPVLTQWSQIERRSTRRLKPEALFLSGARLPAGARYSPAETELVLYETSDAEQAHSWLMRGAHRVETDDIGGLVQRCSQ